MNRDQTLKPKNIGSKLLFQNPWLERLSRTHIALPLVVFFTYASSLLYWNVTHTHLSMGLSITMFLLGFILFTWIEYMTHRYVFHMHAANEKEISFQYTIHGVHHEYPRDKKRLAMPPLLSITIATILLAVFRLILGDLTFAFLPGFLVGYSAYLVVHYMVHVFPPPKNFLRVLWINHSIHHYKNGEFVFGVSSPFWDYVYGTNYSPQIKQQVL